VTVIPVLILLSVAVVLGIVLGLQYLQRERSPPVLIGFHLLLGAGGLEMLAMLLHGTPDRRILPAGALLTAAAAMVMAAMFSGLIAPMVGRQSRRTMNVALLIHTLVGLTGFVLLLAWAARR
jgi:hypothetical protein